MSVRLFKPLALSAVIVMAAFAVPTKAKAGDGGDILAGAIIGITAGAILGSIAHDSHHRSYYEPRYRPRHYRRPVRVYEEHVYYEEPEYIEDAYDAPAYAYGNDGYDAPPRKSRRYSTTRRVSYDAPRPWSKAWYRYCANKYRSFDARSGTYQPYDGPRRRCR